MIDYCGNGCDQTCGNCTNGTHCDRSSGKDPEGCEKHWNGSNCNSKIQFILSFISITFSYSPFTLSPSLSLSFSLSTFFLKIKIKKMNINHYQKY